MSANSSSKEDLLFYILAAIAGTWGLACIVGLLMHTS